MKKSKIDIFGERLKKVAEGFRVMKQFGVDEEILICYLMVHLKIGRSQVEKMIKSTDEFYEKLLKEGIIEGLEEEKWKVINSDRNYF